MQWLTHDLRAALRAARRRPVLSTVVLLTLGCGIAVSSATYTVAAAALLRPPPAVSDDADLVRVRGTRRNDAGQTGPRPLTDAEVEALASRAAVFRAVAYWAPAEVAVQGQGSSTMVMRAALVSPGYFDVLGVTQAEGAILPGRALESPTDAVISHALWVSQYAGASDVIGQRITVDGHPFGIVGVAPPRFGGADAGARESLWLPERARDLLSPAAATSTAADATPGAWFVAARLARGVAREHATSVAAMIAARAAEGAPGPSRITTTRNAGADVVPLRALNASQASSIGNVSLGAAAGIAALILAVACATASALLVGAGIARRREIAIHLALGASRLRMVRKLLTESVALAVAAGVLAFMVVAALARVVNARVAELTVAVDWRTTAFALGVAVVSGILAGLSPTLHGVRLGISGTLKDAGGGSTAGTARLQQRLVVLLVAVAQPLLLALAGLVAFVLAGTPAMSRSGAADRIVVMNFDRLPSRGAEPVAPVLARAAQDLEALPVVTNAVPHSGGVLVTYFAKDVGDADGPGASGFHARASFAAPGYTSLMGLRLLRGRDFTAGDSTAVILSRSVAERLWPGGDPIGQRLWPQRSGRQGDRAFAVVGIMADGPGAVVQPDALVPIGAPSSGALTMLDVNDAGRHALLATVRGDAVAALRAIREELSGDRVPGLVLATATTFGELQRARVAQRTRLASVLAAAAALALVFAAVGLYAVVHLAVQQRRREIGVRMALGAAGSRVARAFLIRALRLGGMGLLLGLPLSVLASRSLTASLGVPLPGIAVVIVVLVLAISGAAAWLPARRAATVSPAEALRTND